MFLRDGPSLHVRRVALLRVSTDVASFERHHTVFRLSLSVSGDGSERGGRECRFRVGSESSLRLRAKLVGRGVAVFLTAELASSHRVKAHRVVAAHAVLVPMSSVSAHTLLTVDFGQGVGVVHRVVSEMSRVRVVVVSTSTAATHVSVAVHVATEAHHATLMAVVAASASASAVSARVRVVVSTAHLFTLQLGLNSLAVRSVSDHGEDGSNAFHELYNGSARNRKRGKCTHEHSLSRVGIVQSGLDNVVGKGISQQLFQSASVEQFANENLSQFRVGDSNALQGVSEVPCSPSYTAYLFNNVGTELLNRQDADVADELSNEGLAESDIVQVEDVFCNAVIS